MFRLYPQRTFRIFKLNSHHANLRNLKTQEFNPIWKDYADNHQGMNKPKLRALIQVINSRKGPFEDMKHSYFYLLSNCQNQLLFNYIVKMFLLNCRESFEKSDAEKTLELSQEKKFSLSGGLLNKLIMTVARRGSKDEVGELIGIVKSTYPNLEFEEIKTHGELKALENDLIQSLEKYSQVNKNELNVHHFTTILNTCLKLNSLDFWNIYKDFKQTKLKPNMALYTVLTRYYFVNDKINEARKLFQDITDGEAKINLHYANVMIHGLMENDLVDEAVGIYNMFGTWNLIPDAVTFGILISHCTSRSKN